MPTWLPPGPYKTLQPSPNVSIPYYIIRFDEDGRCESPQTKLDLVNRVRAEGYSDVFLFSHGWNNDWTAATKRYESFITGYMQMVARDGLKHREGFKPILVGVFWPSTSFVFGEDEEGPKMAAGGDRDSEVAAEGELLRDLARSLPGESRERFYELMGKEWTTPEEARELVALCAPLYASGDDETAPPASSVDELLRNWADWQPEAAGEEPAFDLGHIAPSTQAGAGGPQVAAFKLPSKFSPRSWARAATVWKMKDRAGRVGANGVGSLLRELAAAPNQPRVHLVGHSYGAKVVMSALCAGPAVTVESALLLQPAISHLCFAEKVEGRPGGYRAALDRVRKPIFATFSRNDDPLRNWFHKALRRDKDLGEVQIAGGDNPPNPFAALGGYGPRGSGERIEEIHDPGDPYDLSLPNRVYGIHGTRTIDGHGDISNESTWWALYCLAST
ncbi:MAG: hypothetical protein IT303_01645 [Dehalococcoidia bacterium]|nr:hypothetical protein [Dehalococcoidia bacterium]